LGDVAHTTIGEFVIRTKQNPSSPYPVYNGGTSYTGFYDEYNNEANQIVISARGANAGFVNIVRCRFWGGNSCYAVDLLDKSYFDLDFTYQAIKNNQSDFIKNQQAANIPSVSKNDVETFEFYCPRFDEQRQIGAFFQQLDSLITLHQREFSLPSCGIPIPLFPSIRRESPCMHYRGE
jgi:type I restriction enzyme S subunit